MSACSGASLFGCVCERRKAGATRHVTHVSNPSGLRLRLREARDEFCSKLLSRNRLCCRQGAYSRLGSEHSLPQFMTPAAKSEKGPTSTTVTRFRNLAKKSPY